MSRVRLLSWERLPVREVLVVGVYPGGAPAPLAGKKNHRGGKEEQMRDWQPNKKREEHGDKCSGEKVGKRREKIGAKRAKKNRRHGAAIRAARLISRVLRSITAASEDHRGSLTQAKQTQQVAEEERKASPWLPD